MAGLGIALDAEERAPALGRQRFDHRVHARRVEDLARVALYVRGCELRPRPLSDAGARVLGVLELPQLRRRCEVLEVDVADPGLGERGPEAARIRPRVLAPAHATPLPYVDQDADIGAFERAHERIAVKAVHADGRE